MPNATAVVAVAVVAQQHLPTAILAVEVVQQEPMAPTVDVASATPQRLLWFLSMLLRVKRLP